MSGPQRLARFTMGLATLTVVAVTSAAAADPKPTIAEEALAGWLAAIRSDEQGASRAHFERAFSESFRAQLPVEQYEAMSDQLRPLLTGVDIAPLVTDGQHALSGWFEVPQIGWFEVLLQVETEVPHKIAGLLLRQGTPPDPEQPPFPADGTMQEMLDYTIEQTGIPGMAAAHVVAGKIDRIAVAGLRSAGGDDAIEANDLFHIGSVTKPLTSTMLARLIERGVLNWETKVGDVLEGVPMLPVYREVTLSQLMRHRAGLIPATGFDEEALKRWVGLEGTPTEQRGAFVGYSLNQPPVAEIDTASVYSNAGYGLAGFIAERVTGKGWAELMRTELFEPAELKSAGFGWPRTAGRSDQPSGHYPVDGGFRPQEVDEYSLGEFLSPAGDSHMSIGDLAKFAIVHLRGLRGMNGILKSETIVQLHTPPDGDDYACGWVKATTSTGKAAHWHNGSAGTFYALVIVIPETDEAFAFAFNAAPGAEEAARQIADSLHSRAFESGQP